MFVIALAAALLSGQDAQPRQRTAEELTRDLNSGPPFRPTSPAPTAPTPTPPAPTPAAETPEIETPTTQAPQPAAPAPVVPDRAPPAAPVQAPSPSTGLTRDLNTTLPSATPPALRPAPAATSTPTPLATEPTPAQPPVAAPPVVRPAPVVPTQPTPAPPAPSIPGPRPAPAVVSAPVPTPAPTPTAPPSAAPIPTVRPPASPAPLPAAPPPSPASGGLDAAAVAALPFTVDLPAGAVLTRARAGADANVYSVRRDGRTLIMIYTGTASQFPIYDGELIRAGGRDSVVVTGADGRHAVEHLFQRSSAPQEIHVWIAAAEDADRALAEQIGQSVDVR